MYTIYHYLKLIIVNPIVNQYHSLITNTSNITHYLC